MTIKIPSYLSLAGLLIFAFLMNKRHIPYVSSFSPAIINTICAAASSALISASIFLSLYGFFMTPTARRQFLGVSFVGVVILAGMFCCDFVAYDYINRSSDHYMGTPPNMLSGLVDNTRTDDSAEGRQRWAQVAYKLYGIKLSYRQESGDWAYYNPTSEDQNDYNNTKKLEAAMNDLRKKSRGLLSGAINVVFTAFITFLFGLLWLALKKPSYSEASPR